MKTLEAGKRIALNHILFATDFSPNSEMALPYALAIARQYGARVYGAHVVPSSDYLFSAPDLWPAHTEEDNRLQQEITGRLEEHLHGIPHEVLFGIGDVSTVLSRMIAEHDIDLLVVGTHGRTGARKVLVGSIAEKMFRQATCPVLSVGPHVLQRHVDVGFHNILYATDFGKNSLSALSYALSLAEEDQAELSFLHVVEQPFAGIVDAESVRSSVVSRLQELVPPEAESWCHVECVVEFSPQFALPAEKIVEVAQNQEVDLIILGVRPTHRASSAVTHFAQTNDQYVVAHAPCPVLTVRG
jgi:nucleotide-binding universal stress UspA family protein